MSSSESPAYKWYALGLLTAVYASSHVDRQIMGMLLEPIKQELGVGDAEMGFLVGLTFAIFYATLGMPIAMLADRTNRRNIITAAVTIWSGMTVLCGFAQNFWQMTLARVGVAVGEAGSSPPSHSIISDLFPVKRRATALGIYATGINIGLMIAYLGGGWLSDNVGWRWTFFWVGAPGLLLAVLMVLTIREPRRGASEVPVVPAGAAASDAASDAGEDGPAPSFFSVVAHMWRVPTMRHSVIGSVLAGFIGYGFTLWMPAFFMRSYDLSATETGLTLALLNGVVGGLGTFTAGRLADVLAERDPRWRVWIVGVAKVGYVPFLVAFFLTSNFWLGLMLYLIPAFFGGFYLAPTFAVLQNLSTLRMRALASSIGLFCLNIVGLGFGPWAVGLLSEALQPDFGVESLRYSLMIMALLNLWCGWHYYLAGRTMARDMATVAGLSGPRAA